MVGSQTPTPHPESVCDLHLLGKGKLVSLSVTGHINHTPGQVPYPGAVGQYKTDSDFFCVCAFFLYYCFMLVGWFLFFVLEKEREKHEVG